MNNAFQVLMSALVDSFRPRMLMLTLVSVTAALIFWMVIIWLSVEPVVGAANWLLNWAGFDLSGAGSVDATLITWLKAFLVPLAVFGLLWPVVASSAVLLAGLYVTPLVVKYMASRDFSDLTPQGETGVITSLWITLKAVIVFLLGWIVTLPLWLIPGMAFLLPLLLTSYLLMTVMRHDALSEHATRAELNQIKKRDSTSAWLIGVVCAFLSFVPPVLLIMPVMSALAFTRHYMNTLREIRHTPASPSKTLTIDSQGFTR